MPSGPFAQVAIDRPLRNEFTYCVPPELVARAVPGARVVVPFGSLREVGVIVAVRAEAEIDAERLRPIGMVLDGEPLLSGELLELTRWVAERYACSWGEALHAALPAGLKRPMLADARAGPRGSAETVRAAAGVGAAELGALEAPRPKQHKLLRTLLEIGGPIESRDVLRQLGLSRAPLESLARRGWVSIERRPAERDPFSGAGAFAARPRPERLLPAQEGALRSIGAAVDGRRHATFLLEGVTGSGKTEVYLAAIERALVLGRGAIVLVPEIALTPQTVGWFRSRLDKVAVLHSRLTDAQRLDMWRGLEHGEARVVVGARSAVFAPVPALGVVVVDEEHEPSFKQDNAPRYHARDVARRRAELAGAVCILGSATPSLESWCDAREGRILHLRLPERASGRPLPPVEVVDRRVEPPAPGGSALFSRRLALGIAETLARGEQSILFQNRRGFAPVLWCQGCKETLRCAHCDVALAWHKRIRRLVCHACCEEIPAPPQCPTCTCPRLRMIGAGSERIEQEVGRLFPQARVRRMDSDTMRRRADYEQVLEAFGKGEVDVLVGTQMIAKGLDFPRVTLVGIVDADTALHLPDFRAAERTFQLIAQVAGRAGRAGLPGRIVVQTTAPDHEAIRCASRHDFAGFAEAEEVLRRELGYPPHGRLIRVVFEDREEAVAGDAAQACAEALRSRLVDGAHVQVLGPAPAPISMLRGRHRVHLMVKAPREGGGFEQARGALIAWAAGVPRPRVAIDVDPVSML